MRNVTYALFAALLLSCAGQNKKDGVPAGTLTDIAMAAEPAQDSILLGIQNRKALEVAPFDSWFDTTYEEYRPDSAIVEKLKPLTEGLEIKMFMGTWCGDSRREVPAFFKLLDELEFPGEKVTLITMDRSKATPENLEEGLEVTNVPTLIFMKEGKEINRIVEYPMESLEKDMYNILSGKDYKHAYAW